MPILTTKRLALRQLTLNDAAFILELLNDEAWLKHIGDRGVRTLADAERYITQVYLPKSQTPGLGIYLMELKSTHTSIGICSLLKRDGLDDIDLGFALLAEFRGHGYAAEAAKSVMHHATHTLKLNRLIAITVAYNTDSITLLEKLGFAFEKNIRLPNDPEELRLYAK